MTNEITGLPRRPDKIGTPRNDKGSNWIPACARMTTRYNRDKNPSLIPKNCATIRACSWLRQLISHSLEAKQSCLAALAQA